MDVIKHYGTILIDNVDAVFDVVDVTAKVNVYTLAPRFVRCKRTKMIINGVYIGVMNTVAAKNVSNLIQFLLDKATEREKNQYFKYRYVRYIMSILKKYNPNF